ncbi:ArnT family glycosyltransferase [Elusimicrobiota bacterium]
MLFDTYDNPFLAQMVQRDVISNLVSGRGFSINPNDAVAGGSVDPESVKPYLSYHMPGQALVIAALFSFTNDQDYVMWPVFCMILDAFCVYLLFFSARRFFGDKVAVISAFVFALRIPYAAASTSFLKEAPLTFLGLAIICCFVEYLWGRKFIWACFTGALCGAATYFRSEFFAFVFILCAVSFISILGDDPRDLIDRGYKRGLRFCVAALACFTVLLAPWVMFNLEKHDRLVFTQQVKWPAIWSGFGEMPNDFGAVNSDTAKLDHARLKGCDGEYRSWELDDFYKQEVLWVVFNRPLWLMKLFARRALRAPVLRNYWGIFDTESQEASFRFSGMSAIEYAMKFKKIFIIKFLGAAENLMFHAIAFIGFLMMMRTEEASIRRPMIWIMPFLFNYIVHIMTAMDSRYMLWSSTVLIPLFILGIVSIVNIKRAEG